MVQHELCFSKRGVKKKREKARNKGIKTRAKVCTTYVGREVCTKVEMREQEGECFASEKHTYIVRVEGRKKEIEKREKKRSQKGNWNDDRIFLFGLHFCGHWALISYCKSVFSRSWETGSISPPHVLWVKCVSWLCVLMVAEWMAGRERNMFKTKFFFRLLSLFSWLSSCFCYLFFLGVKLTQDLGKKGLWLHVSLSHSHLLL